LLEPTILTCGESTYFSQSFIPILLFHISKAQHQENLFPYQYVCVVKNRFESFFSNVKFYVAKFRRKFKYLKLFALCISWITQKNEVFILKKYASVINLAFYFTRSCR